MRDATGFDGQERHGGGEPADMDADLAASAPLRRLIDPIAAAGIEHAILLYVADDGRLLAMRHLVGSRDTVDVPPRVVVGEAIALDCRHVVLAHNHPGGDPAASRDDIALTRLLWRTLAAVGVRLHDHLIVSRDRCRSMRAAGQL